MKPKLSAPAWEKALFKTFTRPSSAAPIQALGNKYPNASPTIAMVEVLRFAHPSRNKERLRILLAWLFGIGYEPAADQFVAKYVPQAYVVIPIAPGVVVSVPWSRESIGLLLAELEQEVGNLRRAMEIVEELEPTTVAAVSLAELYAKEGRWSDIVDMTNGLTNDDEAAMFLLIQRGTALCQQGYFEAAREALKEALRVRSRPKELRHPALVARGLAYAAEGKRAMARKDYERVLADDATYPGPHELLGEVAATRSQ